ncbi:hypothetical protein [Algoriphagus halophilus]|uniref:Uncharacterized protein n=1 Tax=Algoriphagus halophilus TaxID=226505 RepID=A0A1N6DYP2_9BACT|nr:hypothetical protein [Algoriphagus halophilus]SIN75861.1 hypothetical protein SAMN05444394_1536 [Algoriphagus halophilus]
MCKVATNRNVARRNNIVIDDVDAQLSQISKRNYEGIFITEVDSAIKISGDISLELKTMLLKEADNCYVTRLMKDEWVFNPSSSLT